MIKDHLKRVASLWCAVCGYFESQAHHLLRVPGGKKGMGAKNDDKWAIPLCHKCHSALHLNGNEVKFLAENGVDGTELATRLFDGLSEDDYILENERRWKLRLFWANVALHNKIIK